MCSTIFDIFVIAVKLPHNDLIGRNSSEIENDPKNIRIDQTLGQRIN